MQNYSKTLLKAMLFTTLLGLAASPAMALEVLKLKERIKVVGDVVTLADIFPGARYHRATPLFKSPALGREGKVAIHHLIDAADRLGFTFEAPTGLKAITVTRPARTIKAARFEELIKKELQARTRLNKNDSLKLTLKAKLTDQMIPLNFNGSVKLLKFSYNKSTKSFIADFAPAANSARAGADENFTRRITGKAIIAYQRPVLARSIKRGETISQADIMMKSFGQYRIPKTALSRKADIIGKTATTNLKQGAFLNPANLEATKIIAKNQVVTLIFNKKGLSLKTQGKAMADAGINESVAVMNIHSKRVVHGQVKAAGVVIIEHGATEKPEKLAQLQF